MLKKPSAYIMHGCVEYENAINLEPDERMNLVERQTMELTLSLPIAMKTAPCHTI